MNNLRKIREKRKVKMEQLALNVGCTANYISLLEREEKTPGLKLAFRLAKELGTTVDNLFGELMEKTNGEK